MKYEISSCNDKGKCLESSQELQWFRKMVVVGSSLWQQPCVVDMTYSTRHNFPPVEWVLSPNTQLLVTTKTDIKATIAPSRVF